MGKLCHILHSAASTSSTRNNPVAFLHGLPVIKQALRELHSLWVFYHFCSRNLPHSLAEELGPCGVDGVVHAADGLAQRRGHKRVPAPTHVRGCPKHKETTKQFVSICFDSNWPSQLIKICAPAPEWPHCRTNRVSISNMNTMDLFLTQIF